jgi:hypothetical protein
VSVSLNLPAEWHIKSIIKGHAIVTKNYIMSLNRTQGARDFAVGGGTALQAVRSRFRFPMVSFRPHYGAEFDSASNRNVYQEYFLRGKGGR